MLDALALLLGTSQPGLGSDLMFFVAAGFLAQLVDGALGMAYGLSSTSLLLGFGVPPAAASASVHAAEVFTTAVSGTSHLAFGNVDRALFKRLVVPGVAGAVLGAYVLAASPGELLRPVVALYLLVMGLVVIRKAFAFGAPGASRSGTRRLGAVAGFCDAVGGGGWGPIVTSTLLARGDVPRYMIGTVNVTEFFVAASASVVFLFTIGVGHWPIIAGLVGGGALAALPAAWLCRRVPARPMLIAVGVLIVLVSSRTLWVVLRS